MTKYNITIGNTKHPISGTTFAWLIIPFLAFIVAYLWIVIGGTYKFGGGWAVFAFLLLSSQVTVNGADLAVLPDPLRKTFTLVASIAAAFYFFFG
jgi:hypothetical protein